MEQQSQPQPQPQVQPQLQPQLQVQPGLEAQLERQPQPQVQPQPQPQVKIKRKAIVKFDKSNLVRYQDKYDQDIQGCSICLEPLEHPQRCLTCKTLYCKTCKERWRNVNKMCPKKCSPNFETEPAEPTGVELLCPFKCEECLKEPIYAESFVKHLSECSLAPEEYKLILTPEQIKEQYLCDEGHELVYLDRDNGFIRKRCQSCTKTLCRSFCQECQISFCVECRPIKALTRRKCVLGHPFRKRVGALSFMLCDCCGESVRQMGEYAYNEKICDFAICKNCFQKLPPDNSTEPYELESTHQF